MAIVIHERKKIQPDSAWTPLLQTATREVFEIMLSAETSLAPETEPPVSTEVTALVGLAGAICGVVSVRCSSETAIQMAGRMTGSDTQEFDETTRDALGEICNMVAGNFKAKITGLADGCMLSVPTVITGADYRLHPMAAGGRVEVAMAFEDSTFWVALDLQS